ncbi:MAG TPA: hypothetical protein VIF62_02800 [Labilithrix sp.]
MSIRSGVIALLVSGGAVASLAVFTACSSSNNNDTSNNTPPAPPPAGDDGGPGSDGGGDASDGGMVDLPKPVLCPEANPFSPKNPNSVLVNDVVLQADTTWTADKVYLIGDDFKVEGHTLTVEAGTTICLYQKGKIFVGEGVDPGEIHLNGTAAKPIVITATPSSMDATKPDVFHGGIAFDTYQGSTISYVNIWYGGPGGGGASWAFELTDTAHGTPDATKPLLVDHLTVGAVQSKGVHVGTPLGVADGSKIRFTGFVTPDASGPALDATARVNIIAAKSFAKAFDITGAPIPDGAKHVLLDPDTADGKVDVDADLVDFGLPYLYPNHAFLEVSGMQDDPIGPTLTIHEGVTLAMDGALVVGGQQGNANGNLIVAGTAAKPVTFTSTAATPAAGDWAGFYWIGGHYDVAKSKIDNAKILYAGDDASDPLNVTYHTGRCGSFDVGAVMLANGSLAPWDGVPISNTLIAHSKSNGITSDANDTGGYCKTNYAKPDITFMDVATSPLAQNGACP